MKALVYTAPATFAYQDAPEPVPGDGEVLVRVESVGICGSDMHAYLGHDGRRPAPLILGHEVAGVTDLAGVANQRVTVNPLVTCVDCAPCRRGDNNLCPTREIISMPPREGGFAGYIAIPEENVVAVPDHIGADQAALCEPLSCSWHAARLARAHPAGGEGARALVIGGGAIGLGAALSLRAQGVEEILLVEPNAVRRSFLETTCGERVVPPEDDAALGPWDIVIDGVGYEATRAHASAVARPGGVIAHIGLGSAAGGLDIRRMTLQEITFIGTYSFTPQDFRDTAQAIFDGRLGPLDWTEARPLADGAAAFDDIRAGRVSAPKIVLKPDA